MKNQKRSIPHEAAKMVHKKYQKAEKEKKNMEINVVKKEVPEKLKHVHAKENYLQENTSSVQMCYM